MNLPRRRLLAATLCLAGGPAFAAEPPRASGNVVSERRALSGFAGVAVGGPFEVVLRPSTAESVELRGDQQVLALVETRLEGSAAHRSLKIGVKRGARLPAGTTVAVVIDFVRLDDISLGGSGRISGSGLRSDRLDVSLGGNGTIKLAALEAGRLDVAIGGSGVFEAEGKADRLELSIGGSGSVEAARLLAREVHASIAGSGNARVHADVALEVWIAGSGSLVYGGAAQAKTAVVGSGTVRKAS